MSHLFLLLQNHLQRANKRNHLQYLQLFLNFYHTYGALYNGLLAPFSLKFFDFSPIMSYCMSTVCSQTPNSHTIFSISYYTFFCCEDLIIMYYIDYINYQHLLIFREKSSCLAAGKQLSFSVKYLHQKIFPMCSFLLYCLSPNTLSFFFLAFYLKQ